MPGNSQDLLESLLPHIQEIIGEDNSEEILALLDRLSRNPDDVIKEFMRVDFMAPSEPEMNLLMGVQLMGDPGVDFIGPPHSSRPADEGVHNSSFNN